MRLYARLFAYLAVSIGISSASAGPAEDFFNAIKRDDAWAVSGLLQRGFDANTVSPERQFGLYLALREPSLKAAQVLADWPRTDVDARNAVDESPLMMAALKGHQALAQRLIERGADVNKPGWTPLHYAATGGQVAMIELLLAQHAYIDAESPNGTTPLMMAAGYGSAQATRALLQAGADATPQNAEGMTALDFALGFGKAESASVLRAAALAVPQ
jgi:ankyrin repeat protein